MPESTTWTCSSRPGRSNPSISYPMSSGLRSMTAHDATKSQNAGAAWPLSLHLDVSPPSWTKNMASISVLSMAPRNSAWLPSSMWSLGDGVAVHASLYGVSRNDSMTAFLVLLEYDFRMLDSSSTTPSNSDGSNAWSIS